VTGTLVPGKHGSGGREAAALSRKINYPFAGTNLDMSPLRVRSSRG
jgi:hypothetical protein